MSLARPAGPAHASGGAVAIVLHSHMPWVHGYGTWPSGEEWLWEVVTTSYTPVFELIEQGAPFTLSLTPVLADQLERPGAAGALRDFIDRTRRGTHDEDRAHLAAAGLTGELAAAEHSWSSFEAALVALDARPDLLAGVRDTAAWTSSATHAILPLLATDAGIRLQVQTGIASHRRRFDTWAGGMWLPECAYAPELDRLLVESGVHAVCVEEPAREGGPGGPRRTPDGLTVCPIDRALMDLVWREDGYPGAAAYRDTNRRSFQNTQLWSNDGAPYDPARGAAQARADAADWATRAADRVAASGDLHIVAFDTELFGHWWHEGPLFLAALAKELAGHGTPLVQLDDALAARAIPSGPHPPVASWGRNRDLSTWSGPQVATIAWETRTAELDLLLSGARPSDAELRELLALQSSDWAFMVAEDRVPGYAWQRFTEHRRTLRTTGGPLPSSAPRTRYLAPDLVRGALAPA